MLLILPPLVQPNTFYPSTTHLAAYLNSVGINTSQLDLSITLLDKILTPLTLKNLFSKVQTNKLNHRQRSVLANSDFYTDNVEQVKSFLQGNNTELAPLFASLAYWQNMPRLDNEEELSWDYGSSGTIDRAKHLCSLFIKNICELLEALDPNFQFIRYAERICTYLPSFDILQNELQKPSSPIVSLMLNLLDDRLKIEHPDFVGLSIPFPGNLLMALHIARHIKAHYPNTKIIMGGGYVNTELRQITDTAIFDYIDYLCFDDGELPLRHIIEGKPLIRTITRENNTLVRHNLDNRSTESIYTTNGNIHLTDGLNLDKYFNFTDSTNAMHRLWSDGRWNKMMLAHGCYWHKCAFCDTSLDYIGNYFPHNISRVVDIMEQFITETGCHGFHFIDEAAPPAKLKALADEILRRKLRVSFWTNIRFDRSFTTELCSLLAQAGCIAVSGGIEVASPRMLKLINKGVTIDSVRDSLRHLSNSGIMVHAYLMYGFPTQTIAELYDSLATVRNFFAEGLLQSAYWHRYAMTCHSHSGQHPEQYHTQLIDNTPNSFANNEIAFTEEHQPEWENFTAGLNLATYNFMRQVGFDFPIKKWFK